MKIEIRNLLTLWSLMLSVVSAFGVASIPGLIDYRQPDGSHIEVYLQGDEKNHWYSDRSGNLLMPDTFGRLIPATEEFTIKLSKKRNTPREFKSQYTNYPTTGRQKVLIILAEFSDKKFTYTLEDFKEMLCKTGYDTNGAAGSARDYFIENSAGRFIPEFEVYGPVTLSHPMSYYGSNDDALAHEMVIEACKALNSSIDFSDYDRDGDGWADNVYLFYAGYGEADGGGVNSVWPHSANIFAKGERLNLDGVGIGSYSCSNELIGGTTRMVGIGTFCHEFSHVLGLPDLYSTNNNSAFTPYYYSLMDHGNYNGDGRVPCNLTAYEKYYLGWCEPRVLTSDGTVNVAPIPENIACRVSLPGYSEEYYLLENRVREGWDAALPGEGLLIWHIDYSKELWDRNGVNNDETRQRVDLVEADGIETMKSSSGDPFPGTSGVKSFDEFKDHTGAHYPYKLSNIRKAGSAVLFDYNQPSTLPVTVKDAEIIEVDDNSFSLKWADVEDATSYLITVSTTEEGRMRNLADYTAYETVDPYVQITGLIPDTRYVCHIRSVRDVSMSDASEPIEVMTQAPGISYFSPKALPAEDILSDGFTARWEEMEQAEAYLLDLSLITEEAGEKTTVEFSSPLELPDGWTSTTTSTMSVNGYYGENAPSLRLSQNAEFLESPVYDKPISSVSFWVRGYKADPTARLILSVKERGAWKEVAEYSGVSNTKGEIYEWSASDALEINAVKLTYLAPSGSSICVDDFTLGFGLSEVKKPVLVKHPVGSTTSFEVKELESGKEYRYVVYGQKGDKISLPSEEVVVRTHAGQSAIKDIIEIDNEVVGIYTLTGIEVTSERDLPPGIYIVMQGEKSIKVIKK